MEPQSLAEILDEIDEIKRQLEKLRPLDNPSILHALEIEYTYESNRIEGNTLTLRETELVIEKGLTVGGASPCVSILKPSTIMRRYCFYAIWCEASHV